MPTYEYLCEKCEHEFEREQSINDPPIKTCPKCKGRKVKKLISATSFVLKGGGWYSDGYGSTKAEAKGETKGETKDEPKGSDAGEGAQSEGAQSEGAKSEPKAETKSDAKSDAKPSAKKKKKGKDAA